MFLLQLPDYCFDQDYEDLHDLPISGGVAPPESSSTKYSNTVISLEHSLQDLLRDAKEKFKSWMTCFILGLDVAYKKVTLVSG